MDKISLHQTCLNVAQEKLQHIVQSIADARDASNNDTKSSMGDKYETTREMMQIELNKLQLQLQDLQQTLLALKVLNPAKVCAVVEPGALVVTDKATFYLAAPLGKVAVNNSSVMVVSPASPIGRAMLGKKAGDSFTLNQVTYGISEIG